MTRRLIDSSDLFRSSSSTAADRILQTHGHARRYAAILPSGDIGRDATVYLLEKDAPFVDTAERYRAGAYASIIWEGHKAGRDIGYCHIEKLHNLEELPSAGFHESQRRLGWVNPGCRGVRQLRRSHDHHN